MDKRFTTVGAAASLVVALGGFGAISAFAHSTSSTAVTPAATSSAIFATEVRGDASSDVTERAAEQAEAAAAAQALAASQAAVTAPAVPAVVNSDDPKDVEEAAEAPEAEANEHHGDIDANKGAEEAAETGDQQSAEHQKSDTPDKASPMGDHPSGDDHGGHGPGH